MTVTISEAVQPGSARRDTNKLNKSQEDIRKAVCGGVIRDLYQRWATRYTQLLGAESGRTVGKSCRYRTCSKGGSSTVMSRA